MLFVGWYVAIFVFAFGTLESEGMCTFPTQLVGKWYLSRTNVVVTFTSTHVTDFNLTDAPVLNNVFQGHYECFAAYGSSRFALKSVIQSVVGRNLYTCLDLNMVGNTWNYIHASTSTGATSRPKNYVLDLPANIEDAMAPRNICDIDPSTYRGYGYHSLVPEGEVFSNDCPMSLQAIMSTPSCTKDVNGCSKTAISIGSPCTNDLFYHNKASTKCVFSLVDIVSGLTYVTLYNTQGIRHPEGRFVCMVLSADETSIQLTQNPLECTETQTTTTGGAAFTLQRTVTTSTPSLSTEEVAAVSSVLVFIIIAIIVAIILIICCLRRKRKKREEERKRREKEDTESGYGGSSGRRRRKIKKKPRKLPKRVRKIYDENGKLIREEAVSSDSDDSGDETVYIRGPDGKRIKKRRMKKTRRYLRERTLPDGTKVKEWVESDYYETCSEHTASSSDDETVEEEIRKAIARRQKERAEILEKLEGRQEKEDLELDISDLDPDDPDDPSRRDGKRFYKLGEATDGPVVSRDEYEKRRAKKEKGGENKPGFFKRLARRKHRLTMKKEEEEDDAADDADEEKNVNERDPYMAQYKDKKRLENKLDDEGFFEDNSKTQAKDIFQIDDLEAILDGTKTADTPVPEAEDVPEEETEQKTEQKQPEEHDKKEETKPPIDKDKEVPRPKEKKVKKDVRSRISKLLTSRLFPPDPQPKKKGHVIFVEEAQGTTVGGDGSLPPLRQVSPQKQHPGFRGPVIIDPTQASLNREGLARDQHFLQSVQDGDNEDENGSGKSNLKRPYLRQFQTNSKRFRGNVPEAWGIGSENGSKNGADKDEDNIQYRMKAPKFHSYLDYLRGRGSRNNPGSVTERDTPSTKHGGKSGRLLMDDARLRRLLEELYKDKKYMDAIIIAEETQDEAMVKGLAEHGRDYLLDMALYWERKGPLPPRPSMTALGFRLERSKSMVKMGNTSQQRPEFQRNKTVC